MNFRIIADPDGGWYIESADRKWRTLTIRDKKRVDEIFLAVTIYGKSAYQK